MLFTFREPDRRKTLKSEHADRAYKVREGWQYLWQRRSFYGRIYLGIGAIAITFLGIPAWYPSYLIRVHGMSPVEVGLQFGTVTLFSGMTGTFLRPWVAQLVERRGHQDAALRTAAFSLIGTFCFCVSLPFAADKNAALAIAAGIIFFCSFPTGIMAFATQLATPGRMRGTAASFYTIFAQIIGYRIGPTMVATLTDRVFGAPEAVGRSLQIVTSTAVIVAGLMLFSVLRPYRHLLAANARDDDQPLRPSRDASVRWLHR